MILLDTHTLVWLINDNKARLSKKVGQLLDAAIKNQQLFVSSFSIWEVFLLIKKGKLKLSLDSGVWLEKLEQVPYLEFIPVNNRIAAKAVNLTEPIPKDPADRIIIATALELGATLVTSDEKILNYPHVQTLW